MIEVSAGSKVYSFSYSIKWQRPSESKAQPLTLEWWKRMRKDRDPFSKAAETPNFWAKLDEILFFFFDSASLVPVFTFGEHNTQDQEEFKTGIINFIMNLLFKYTRLKINRIIGRGIFQKNFGLLPHRRPITTVGKKKNT